MLEANREYLLLFRTHNRVHIADQIQAVKFA